MPASFRLDFFLPCPGDGCCCEGQGGGGDTWRQILVVRSCVISISRSFKMALIYCRSGDRPLDRTHRRRRQLKRGAPCGRACGRWFGVRVVEVEVEVSAAMTPMKEELHDSVGCQCSRPPPRWSSGGVGVGVAGCPACLPRMVGWCNRELVDIENGPWSAPKKTRGHCGHL